MLLAIDIGNSTIKFGIFDRKRLVQKFSVPTYPDYSPGEFLIDRLRYFDEKPLCIDIVLVSSVVPEINDAITAAARELYNVTPTFVGPSADFGLQVDYSPIESLGSDRLIAAFAAAEKYGKPCIVCSFGTATTIDVVNSAGEFLGGLIAPGMAAMADSLNFKTAKLPRVVIKNPKMVIGKSTETAIRSGVFHGHAGMVNHLISLVAKELAEKAMVVATGGFADMVAAGCKAIDIVDDILILEGLRLFNERPKSAASRKIPAS